MTDKLHLRAIEQRDLQRVLRWENDEAAWDYSDCVAPISERMIVEYISSYQADPFSTGQLRLMLVTDTDTPAGIMDLYRISAIHAHAFIGIYIAPEMRRQGVGKAGLELLCEYAFRRLGLRSLCALIFPENEASVRLFEKEGFEKTGFLPSWRRTGISFSDVMIYTRRR